MLNCAECQCVMDVCKNIRVKECHSCTKETCCCFNLHKETSNTPKNSVLVFLYYAKRFFAAALGIEILCISAAVIGENSALYVSGNGVQGIIFGYIFGYVAAGLATFIAILGRYDFRNANIDSCCSVLERDQSSKGFFDESLDYSNKFW